MEKFGEVYIGNGVTVNPDLSVKIKIVDIPKLRKLYTENKDKAFYTGMAEDWFFTATPIKSEKDVDNLSLRSSCWATPVVEIDDERTDCYLEVDEELYNAVKEEGYRAGMYRFEFWLHDLYARFNKLGYKRIRRFWDETEGLLKKYESELKVAPNNKE